MDDYLNEALKITKAQASVRVMKEEEIIAVVQKIVQGIRATAENELSVELNKEGMALAGRKSVKERSVTCLECDKNFKVLTKRHLAIHEMGIDDYREKWAFKKGIVTACTSQKNIFFRRGHNAGGIELKKLSSPAIGIV